MAGIMKRNALLALILIVCLTMLAACGSKSSSSGGGSASPGSSDNGKGAAEDGNIELRLLDYMGEEGPRPDMLRRLISEFEAQNPGIKVKRETIPFADYEQKILQAGASDNIHDIVQVNYLYLAKVASVLEPIQNYWSEETLSRFIKANVDAGTLDQTVYGVQIMGANNVALNYNKKHFADAGLEPPTTWEELEAAAKALTGNGKYGLALSAVKTAEALWQFLPFFWSNGAELGEVNSPEGVEALTFVADLVKNGYMSREVVNWNQGAVLDQFLAGNASMMINGPWNTVTLEESGMDYGVITVPVPKPGASPVVAIGGEIWTLGKTGDQQRTEAAAKFLEYMAEPSKNIEIAEAWGYLPSIKEVADTFIQNNPIMEAYVKQMETAKPMYDPLDYSEIDVIMQTAIQSALSGALTPQAALDQAAAEIAKLK